MEEGAPPDLVGKVPGDGFGKSGGKVVTWAPPELLPDAGEIHRVAAVVARSVGDVGDGHGMWFVVGARGLSIELGAEGVDKAEVGEFTGAAEVVGGARPGMEEELEEGGAVVVDVEPISALLSVAVQWERAVLEGADEEEGKEFFGKLARAVVVGATGDDQG